MTEISNWPYTHVHTPPTHNISPTKKEKKNERLMHMAAETIVNVYNLSSTEARTERSKGPELCRNGNILK